MLIENTLFGVVDKVEIAIRRLKSFEPSDGFYVAFGGGKDSIVVLDLVKRSGVKYDAHYTITSVDPPELIRYIRKYHPDVAMDYPRDADGKVVTMWNLIPKHTIPPTRQARYCCASIKEVNGKGRITVTGVRWDESARRKKLHGVANVKTNSKRIIEDALETNPAAKLNDRGSLIMNDDNDESRRIIENCYRTRKVMVNPIVDWTDEEVWEYIHARNLPYCELYDQGYTRIGCIGCPLAGAEKMRRDFERYPKYRDNYIRAFDRMIKAHPGEIKIATGEPAENGGGSSEHGSSGAEPLYKQHESYSYKSIRNGTDGCKWYKWWIEEAIEDGDVGRYRSTKSGGRIVREKAVRPTGELCLNLWIETLIGGDTDGPQWVPLDKNGNNTKHFREC